VAWNRGESRLSARIRARSWHSRLRERVRRPLTRYHCTTSRYSSCEAAALVSSIETRQQTFDLGLPAQRQILRPGLLFAPCSKCDAGSNALIGMGSSREAVTSRRSPVLDRHRRRVKTRLIAARYWTSIDSDYCYSSSNPCSTSSFSFMYVSFLHL